MVGSPKKAASPRKAALPKKMSSPKKKKTTKKPAAHPPVQAMVAAAIAALKERKGSSLQAIKKYIAANNKVNMIQLSPHIKRCLKAGVASGKFKQASGTGAAGRFRLGKVPAAPKKKKAKQPKAKKAKKPKARKPKAKKAKKAKKPKKPAAKKAKKPKAKKAVKPKKAKTTKKAAKPKAKKVTKAKKAAKK